MADKKRPVGLEPARAALQLHAASSEDEVHKAGNVVLDVLYRQWQTKGPSDSAWIALDLDPPTAIQRLLINNAGSALLEVYGLQEGKEEATDVVGDDVSVGGSYELLLPAQQLMSAGDVRDKKNTNREFVYEAGTKLLKLAMEHKWRRLKLVCKQPFGAQDEPIGLARVRAFRCDTLDEEAAKSRHEARLARVQAAVADFDSYQKKPLTPSHQLPLAKLSDEPDTETPKDPPKPTGTRLLPSWMSAPPAKPAKGTEHGNGRGTKRKAEEGEQQERKTPRGGSKSRAKRGGEKEETEESEGQQKGRQPSRRQSQRGKRTSDGETDSDVDESSQGAAGEGKGKVPPKSPSEGGTEKRRTPASDAETEGSNHGTEGGLETEVASTNKQVPFAELLQGVVFAISGLQNPERGRLRKQAEDMGAEYRGDWGKECTLLVCAYRGSPKFNQVKKANGTIVNCEWIPQCHSEGRLVDIDGHLLFAGKPWRKQTVADDNQADAHGKASQPGGRQLEDDRLRQGVAAETRDASSSQQEKTKRDKKSEAGCHEALERRREGQRKRSRSEMVADVTSWVDADVAAAERFLEREGAEPGPGETVRDLGVQGVLSCFDFIMEELEAGSNLEEAREGWVTTPPRGVQEIADTCAEEERDLQIMWLREMKEQYESVLEVGTRSKECEDLGGRTKAGMKEQVGGQELDGDESVSVIVLSSVEIAAAKEALLRQYATRNA